MRYWIAIGLLWFAVAPAHAFTGAQLYQECTKAPKNSMEDLACISYLRGFIDGMVMARAGGAGFCPPQHGILVDQGRQIAEKYLKDHPDDLHLEAGLVLGTAFIKAFPCASKK
jgi:hypothetical protein